MTHDSTDTRIVYSPAELAPQTGPNTAVEGSGGFRLCQVYVLYIYI